MSDKAWEGMYVGHSPDSPAYLIYNPITNRVIASRSVQFNEAWLTSRIPMKINLSPPEIQSHPIDFSTLSPPEIDIPHELPSSSTHGDSPKSSPPIPPSPTVTAAPVSIQDSSTFQWISEFTALAALDSGHLPFEPTTFTQALNSDHASEWLAAINSELASLNNQSVWEFVPASPHIRLLQTKWVFKIKLDAHRNIARFKARLCAKGFNQREGIDYSDVFAPVMKSSSLRTALALAASLNWVIYQIDVDCAFLYAVIDEDIYIKVPEGVTGAPANSVCKLKKSLYGLKHSPRNWNSTLHQWLISHGFTQSKADPAVYIIPDTCILLIYVDDIIIIAQDDPWAINFKQDFSVEFRIKDLGELHWVIGMEVIRDRQARTLYLNQTQYIKSILKRFNMIDCHPVTTPCLIKGKSNSAPFSDPTLYKSLVGSLLYAAGGTRPDIAFAVGQLARHMDSPTEADWSNGKHVLKYLAGSLNKGLKFGGSDAHCSVNTQLVGFSDADYAGDILTRRSTTGYIFFLNGGAVSWKSRLQPTVALSTAEAEYMALCSTTCEALFLRALLLEFGFKQPATAILEDNQSAINMSKSAMTQSRSKHIDVRFHFTREKLLSGEIFIKYCPTKDMIADILTKPLVTDRVRALTSLFLADSQ